MIDRFGRTIDYLRLSVTDRCNLRCRYCMPHDVPFVEHESILRFEEILRVCGIAARLGIRHLKVTGGEPLVRKGCAQLVSRLKAIEGIETVTITTNAMLLNRYLPQLADAGLDGVNISLDTLNRERYAAITGTDGLPTVLEAVDSALAAGIRTKINCVPLASTPMDELLEVVALAEARPLDVRMIEMMPIGSGADFASADLEELLRRLNEKYPDLHESDRKRGFGPANYYESTALRGSIGLIRAVSRSFCDRCNRIRLTSEGYLKLCLCHGTGVDLRALLRNGADDERLYTVMEQAIFSKPAQHSFGAAVSETRAMSQIGG